MYPPHPATRHDEAFHYWRPPISHLSDEPDKLVGPSTLPTRYRTRLHYGNLLRQTDHTPRRGRRPGFGFPGARFWRLRTVIKTRTERWRVGWIGRGGGLSFYLPTTPSFLFCCRTYFCFLFSVLFLCRCDFAVWRIGKMETPRGWNGVVECM
jgi:hypothetical protein